MGGYTNENLDTVFVAPYVKHKLYASDITLLRNGDVWSPSPKLYWPVSDKINFFSYAPVLPPVATFQVTSSEATDTASIHYFVSDFTTDLLYGCNYGLSREDGQVKIDLQHAMSRIHFLFRNKPKCATVCQIYRVDIVNVLDRGDFIFPTSTTSDASASVKGTWRMDTMLNYKDILIRKNPAQVSDTAKILDTHQLDMFVIPQEIKKVEEINEGGHYISGIYLAIRCKFAPASDLSNIIWPVEESPGYDKSTNSAYVFVPLRLDSCTEWLQGCYYTYTVNLSAPGGYNPDDINFIVTVSVYDDMSETDISN